MSRPFTAARARNEGAGGPAQVIAGVGVHSVYRRRLRAGTGVAAPSGGFPAKIPRHSPWSAAAEGSAIRSVRCSTGFAISNGTPPVGEAAACGGDSLMRVEPFRAAAGFDARLSAGEEPELLWSFARCRLVGPPSRGRDDASRCRDDPPQSVVDARGAKRLRLRRGLAHHAVHAGTALPQSASKRGVLGRDRSRLHRGDCVRRARTAAGGRTPARRGKSRAWQPAGGRVRRCPGNMRR